MRRLNDAPDFGERARAYDELRPQGVAWWAAFESMVRDGDLRGRRVLDIGCGTGSLAEALVERVYAKVWGIDASKEMIAVARARTAPGAGFRIGRAEALPFRAAWFERVVMSLVVHLIDRPRAFDEARRVLADDGRLVIATFTPEHFASAWLTRYFPSLEAIDRDRFPTLDDLRRELAAARFGDVTATTLRSVDRIAREHALARIRGRHISTFDLLSPDELAEGTARAEQGLPEVVDVVQRQLIVTARGGEE